MTWIVGGALGLVLGIGCWWWVMRRPAESGDHVSQGWCDQHKREGRH